MNRYLKLKAVIACLALLLGTIVPALAQTAPSGSPQAAIQEIAGQPGISQARRIVGRIGEEYFLLSADEIYAFQAEVDIVWIITAKKKYLATLTLKVLEQRLRNTSFRRIHRNALVNVDHVRRMSALSSQRWLITLSNDQEFIASKRQAGSIRQLLNG